jgi:hypothetical protein
LLLLQALSSGVFTQSGYISPLLLNTSAVFQGEGLAAATGAGAGVAGACRAFPSLPFEVDGLALGSAFDEPGALDLSRLTVDAEGHSFTNQQIADAVGSSATTVRRDRAHAPSSPVSSPIVVEL